MQLTVFPSSLAAESDGVEAHNLIGSYGCHGVRGFRFVTEMCVHACRVDYALVCIRVLYTLCASCAY